MAQYIEDIMNEEGLSPEKRKEQLDLAVDEVGDTLDEAHQNKELDKKASHHLIENQGQAGTTLKTLSL